MAGAVAVVLAFCAKEETIQAVMLADGVNFVPTSGEHLMDVTLMRHVEDEAILWRVEHAMEREREFNHPEVRTKMPAGLAECLDQRCADFFREIWQSLEREGFEIGWGGDGCQFVFHGSKESDIAASGLGGLAATC